MKMEDPFAIHLIAHSADKMLLDIAKKRNEYPSLDWELYIKDEYQRAFFAKHRATYNYFKHAKEDFRQLPVHDIMMLNVMTLFIAIANYTKLFKEQTQHMTLFQCFVMALYPEIASPPQPIKAKMLESLGMMQTMAPRTFLPDGQRLASGSFDHKVKVWDPSTGQETLTLHGHTDTVPAVAFSPDGWRLASASEDGTIRVWDASPITEPPPRELRTITGHTDDVRAVAYSPNGRSLASAGDDMIVRLWDAASGRIVRLFQGHTHPVSGLAFSPDGIRIVSSDHEGTVRVWDVVTGSLVVALRDSVEDMTMGIAYCPDGRTFATGGDVRQGQGCGDRQAPQDASRARLVDLVLGLQSRRSADRHG